MHLIMPFPCHAVHMKLLRLKLAQSVDDLHDIGVIGVQ